MGKLVCEGQLQSDEEGSEGSSEEASERFSVGETEEKRGVGATLPALGDRASI